MEKFKVLDLFAGIGGMSLGLHRTGGFETIAFCEIDKDCREILKKHWPRIPIFEDIRELKGSTNIPHITRDYWPLKESVDVIHGSFPCQDISVGGNQKGIIDEKTKKPTKRSGLWKEMYRLIDEIRPRYVTIENVENIRKNGLGVVLRDLSKIGYDAEWHCLTARGAIGLPHQRDRLFLISYPSSLRQDGCFGGPRQLSFNEKRKSASNKKVGKGRKSEPVPFCEIFSRGSFDCIRDTYASEFASVSQVRRVTDGVSDELDEKDRKRRIKQLGNSLIPQIAEAVGKCILENEGRL
jgi:DNA (cytosine-5)-methyltransferase 1